MDAVENARAHISEIRDEMAKIAELKRTVTYSELFNNPYGLDMSNIEHNNEASSILGSIGDDEGKNLPMLTAVVVHKTGDMQPGLGFYDLAMRLGKLPINASNNKKYEFWVEELKKVYDHYNPTKKP